MIAVTGASGYVGSIIAETLDARPGVVRLVRRPVKDSDIPWSLEGGPDITDPLRQRGVRTLIHAAWDMQANDPAAVETRCVQGSAALFAAAERAGVERIVFISSISAFEGCRSVYGRSKLAVEQMLTSPGRIVLRPGLVYGPRPGGVFGNIRKQVRNSKVLPLIGDGSAPQYLLHQETLSAVMARAAEGEFDEAGAPITLAHPEAIAFRDLVRDIAAAEHRQLTLVPVPWRLLWTGIRAGEMAGLRLPFRSDSIISFIYQNRQPEFGPMFRFGIHPVPYELRARSAKS